MRYDQLTRGWRIAYGIVGSILLPVGVVGTLAEIYLALHGFPLAWIAALIAVGLAVLGAYLLIAVRAGRIRSLGLGGPRPNSEE
jgi:hypothetical protein